MTYKMKPEVTKAIGDWVELGIDQVKAQTKMADLLYADGMESKATLSPYTNKGEQEGVKNHTPKYEAIKAAILSGFTKKEAMLVNSDNNALSKEDRAVRRELTSIVSAKFGDIREQLALREYRAAHDGKSPARKSSGPKALDKFILECADEMLKRIKTASDDTTKLSKVKFDIDAGATKIRELKRIAGTKIS